METNKKLILRTIDGTYEHDFVNVHIFTTQYKRKIKRREFHAPGPSKIIVETPEKLYRWVFKDIIIRSDEYGNIIINSNDTYSQIKLKKPYFRDQDIKKALYLTRLYNSKKLLHITPEEAAEYDWARKITLLYKVIHFVKVPRYVGGGI